MPGSLRGLDRDAHHSVVYDGEEGVDGGLPHWGMVNEMVTCHEGPPNSLKQCGLKAVLVEKEKERKAGQSLWTSFVQIKNIYTEEEYAVCFMRHIQIQGYHQTL